MHLKSQVLSGLNPQPFPRESIWPRAPPPRIHLARPLPPVEATDIPPLLGWQRRQKYPITIGCRPPRLLRSASRGPPKSYARTWSGQVPAKSKFVRDVIAESSSGPDCANVTISRIC